MHTKKPTPVPYFRPRHTNCMLFSVSASSRALHANAPARRARVFDLPICSTLSFNIQTVAALARARCHKYLSCGFIFCAVVLFFRQSGWLVCPSFIVSPGSCLAMQLGRCNTTAACQPECATCMHAAMGNIFWLMATSRSCVSFHTRSRSRFVRNQANAPPRSILSGWCYFSSAVKNRLF